MAQPEQYHAIGRRKEASARIFLRPGNGTITVNGELADEYFGRDTLMMILRQPLVAAEMSGQWDVYSTTRGGGKSGQADAIKLGIARALELAHPELRALLKAEGHLTRDARIKERKKYGQRGARARFQFSKR
jgi:small subunit ribosomal protein S9